VKKVSFVQGSGLRIFKFTGSRLVQIWEITRAITALCMKQAA
jgi:hypothetical protein